MELLRGAGLGDTLQMPRSKFVAEHKKLVGVLKHGTRKQQLAEARDQSAELKTELKGGAYTILHDERAGYLVRDGDKVVGTAQTMKEAKALVARERAKTKTTAGVGDDSGYSSEVAKAFAPRRRIGRVLALPVAPIAVHPDSPRPTERGLSPPPPPKKPRGRGLSGGMYRVGDDPADKVMAKWKDVEKEKEEDSERGWTEAERSHERDMEARANKKGLTRIRFHGVVHEVPLGTRRAAIIQREKEREQLAEAGRMMAEAKKKKKGKGVGVSRPARVAPARPPPRRPSPPSDDPAGLLPLPFTDPMGQAEARQTRTRRESNPTRDVQSSLQADAKRKQLEERVFRVFEPHLRTEAAKEDMRKRIEVATDAKLKSMLRVDFAEGSGKLRGGVLDRFQRIGQQYALHPDQIYELQVANRQMEEAGMGPLHEMGLHAIARMRQTQNRQQGGRGDYVPLPETAVGGGNQAAGFIRRMMAETKKKHGGEPYGDEDADESYRNPTKPLAPDTTMKKAVAFDYFSMPKESRAMSKHIMEHFFKVRPYRAGEREELNEWELTKLREAEAERQRRSRARRRGDA